MTDETEREDWLSLVESPGFARFTAYALKTWEDEFHKRVLEAIGTKAVSLEHLQLAQARLQQAAAIREELRGLLAYPKQRLQALVLLESVREGAGTSRRPPGM